MRSIRLENKKTLKNKSILQSLQNSKQLQVLQKLDEDDSIRQFANILSSLTSLQKLSLQLSKDHTQSSMYQIYKGLENLINLDDLELSITKNAYLRAEEGRQIGKSLKKLIKIQRFSLIIDNFEDQEQTIIGLKKGIQTLVSLKELNLEFQNGKIGKIPSLFDEQQNLTILSLTISNIELNEKEFYALGDLISRQNNITKLKLLFTNLKLQQNSYQYFSFCLPNLTQLIELDIAIQNSCLTKEEIESLSSGLSKISKLEKFNFFFQENKDLEIYKTNPLLLLEGLQYHPNLQSIYFQSTVNNGEDNSQFQYLSHVKDITLNLIFKKEMDISLSKSTFLGMRTFSNVAVLSITFSSHSNYTLQEAVREFGKALKRMIQLEELFLEFKVNSYIKLGGAIKLGRGISQLKNLRKLNLQILESNWIGEEGLRSIGLSFHQLEKLEDLTIKIGSQNYINPEGFRILCAGIAKLMHLTKLYFEVGVTDNKISSKELNYLGQALSDLFQLRELELYLFFSLQEQGQGEFIESFSQMMSLKHLKCHFQANTSKGFIFSLLESISKINLETLSIQILHSSNNYQSLVSLLKQIHTLKSLTRLEFLSPFSKENKNNILDLKKYLIQIKNLQLLNLPTFIGQVKGIKQAIRKYVNSLVIFNIQDEDNYSSEYSSEESFNEEDYDEEEEEEDEINDDIVDNLEEDSIGQDNANRNYDLKYSIY